jgi:hypothetical protein
LLEERIDKTNPCRELTAEETKRLVVLATLLQAVRNRQHLNKFEADGFARFLHA